MEDKIIVFVTVGNMDTAETIAKALVEDRLAACVNVVPNIRSFYRWEGKIEEDAELLLLIKTRTELFDDLKKKVLALHPYDLPEAVGVEISMGHKPYLEWIEGETK